MISTHTIFDQSCLCHFTFLIIDNSLNIIVNKTCVSQLRGVWGRQGGGKQSGGKQSGGKQGGGKQKQSGGKIKL